MNSLQLINTSLLVVAGINFGMAGMLYIRQPKDISHRLFSFVLIFTAIWIIGLYTLRVSRDYEVIDFGWRLSFIGGMLLSNFLYLFSFHFVHQIPHKVIQERIAYLLLLLGIIICLCDPGMTRNILITEPVPKIIHSQFSFLLASLSMIYSFCFITINLFKKLRSSSGHSKKALQWAMTGVITSIILGFIFDLAMPFFSDESLNWIGAYSTIVMNLILVRFLTSKD